MSLAVAMTKHGAVFSCIHVRMEPNTRVEVPLSPLPPCARAFSISSIQTMHGAIVSAIRSAERARSSDSPIMLPNNAPTSSRSRGIRHIAPIIFAVRLLPVPGMPMRAMPLGAGSP